jgi:hypothetical protein
VCKKKALMTILFYLAILNKIALAAFVGPSAIIHGGWGSGDLDFSYGSEESPSIILLQVDDLGNIVIGDGGNFRIKKYNAAGVFQN